MIANDTSIDARDWSLLGLLSVLWGGSFFFNGVVLNELPPLTVVFLRVTLAAIMLLPLVRLYKVRFPDSLSGWAPTYFIRVFGWSAGQYSSTARAGASVCSQIVVVCMSVAPTMGPAERFAAAAPEAAAMAAHATSQVGIRRIAQRAPGACVNAK